MPSGQGIFSQIRSESLDGGVDLGSILALPPGGNVFYVRSTGAADFDPPGLAQKPIETTLGAALAHCRANKGDTVVCLPGHSESVAAAGFLANLVAGVRIVGIGHGSMQPTFRWTATAGNWAIDDANTSFINLKLRLEGANGVTEAITVTAADVTIQGCDIETSSGASNKVTSGINVSTGANRFKLMNNTFRGTAAGMPTTIVKVSAAVDGVRILNNDMACGASATNGLITVTAAATNLKIEKNSLDTLATAGGSTYYCISVGSSIAAHGVVAYNTLTSLSGTNTGWDAGTGATHGGIHPGTTANVRCVQNYYAGKALLSGLLSPASS